MSTRSAGEDISMRILKKAFSRLCKLQRVGAEVCCDTPVFEEPLTVGNGVAVVGNEEELGEALS